MRPASFALVLVLFITGCLTQPPAETDAALMRAERAAAERSRNRLVVGSTKADVIAALGTAQVIPFDSGYEVWLYRIAPPGKPASGKTELVVLFSPAGLVSKSRVRAPQ